MTGAITVCSKLNATFNLILDCVATVDAAADCMKVKSSIVVGETNVVGFSITYAKPLLSAIDSIEMAISEMAIPLVGSTSCTASINWVRVEGIYRCITSVIYRW